jgi:hypothetical protein
VKLPVRSARLLERRSDEKDLVALLREIRDNVINQQGEYWREVTTTDATVTSIWTDSLPSSSVAHVELVVVGEIADGTTAGGYWRRAVFRRAGTAAAVQIGATDTLGGDKEDVAGWDAGLSVDPATTGNVRATVQGAAATTVNWRAYVRALVQPWQ